MALSGTVGRRGVCAHTMRSTARFTLAAALCMLAQIANTSWVQHSQLLANDGALTDSFGWAVAISGDTVVVGAPFDDTAAGQDAGSAYVFTRSGNTWSQEDHLFASDAAADDWFGSSVAIDGDSIVVCSPNHDTAAGDNAGSAYVFGHPFLRFFVGEPEPFPGY